MTLTSLCFQPACLPPRSRFMLALSSLVLLDTCITGIYISVSGRFDVLGSDLLANVLIFGVLNSLGAWFLFSPVQRHLDGREKTRAAVRQMDRLPFLVSAWVIFCTIIYCLTGYSLGIFVPDGTEFSTVSPLVLVGALVWFCFVYALYYGFYAYFVVSVFINTLKQELSTSGFTFSPGRTPIVRKLVIIFTIVALLPASLIAMDLSIFREVRAAQGLSVEQNVFLDLLASVFLVGITLIFTVRSFNLPMKAISQTVARVSKGDFSVQVPVVSNDELGSMAEQVNAMIRGLRERELIKDTFGRYVPGAIVNKLLERQGALEPQLQTATILFADIVGFTGICESRDPKTVLDMLNEYFSAMTEEIDRNSGVVNQFQGDAMLVTFNLPIPDALHPEHAILAALGMQKIVSDRMFCGVNLDIRVGIHTGEVIAGAVGSEQRLSYTVHGDAVNLAARLEEMNKELGTSILLSNDTAVLLDNFHAFKAVGKVEVRGRENLVDVYSIAT